MNLAALTGVASQLQAEGGGHPLTWLIWLVVIVVVVAVILAVLRR